jgi:integrase/recombinase XerC
LELVESFCAYRRKQRGKTEGGVKTYRWNLDQCLRFVRARKGSLARVGDLSAEMIQAWMDDMASADLALSTMRARQSTLSSFCGWLVKRGVLLSNPVAQLDRPPHRQEAPRQVPGPALMDALVQAARQRGRLRDIAIFCILRYTGMRRESVATLRMRNLDPAWGLRNVPVKGGNPRHPAADGSDPAVVRVR